MLKKYQAILGVGVAVATGVTALISPVVMASPVTGIIYDPPVCDEGYELWGDEMCHPITPTCDDGYELGNDNTCHQVIPTCGYGLTLGEDNTCHEIEPVIIEVVKEVPVEKIVIKEVEKEVLVEKVVTTEVEVPVEKVVVKEVPTEKVVENVKEVIRTVATETGVDEATLTNVASKMTNDVARSLNESLTTSLTKVLDEKLSQNSGAEVPNLGGEEKKETWNYWWIPALALGFAAGFAIMAVLRQSRDDR